MSALLCCSYLRVYRPLEAFPQAERERIELAVRDPSRARSTGGHNSLCLIAPEERRETYVTEIDGRVYVCPAQTRLRTILGMLAFERALPEGVGRVFFSEREMSDARRELELIQSADVDLRPSIVQSPWHVPLRWFVCFEDAERRIEQVAEHPRIRYRSTVGRARERVGEALEIVKGGIIHPVMVGMIFELREWLGTFDEESVLELDYASVATLFDPEELADDHSAADVWNAIRALGEGDGMKAGLYYRRANERWIGARQRETLN